MQAREAAGQSYLNGFLSSTKAASAIGFGSFPQLENPSVSVPLIVQPFYNIGGRPLVEVPVMFAFVYAIQFLSSYRAVT